MVAFAPMGELGHRYPRHNMRIRDAESPDHVACASPISVGRTADRVEIVQPSSRIGSAATAVSTIVMNRTTTKLEISGRAHPRVRTRRRAVMP
ncbi:hypothetical protein ALI144C_30900 [Actinosynnema sp. ALI-1.44]|nr:hypothetical protein ALI144C_30900 [Actinosynnema sp. ALI-1.44]